MPIISRPNNPLAAKTSEEFLQRMDEARDRFRGVVRAEVRPEDLVRRIAADEPRESLYRVVQAKPVDLPGGQRVTLRRDQVFALGRYGAAVVDAWVRLRGLQLVRVPATAEEPAAPPAPGPALEAEPPAGPEPEAADTAEAVSPDSDTTEAPAGRRGRKARREA